MKNNSYIFALFITSLGVILMSIESLLIKIYKSNIKIILIAGILTAFANMFFINAIKHTTIANTVIIISSSPLFAMLFAYVFYKQKLKKMYLLHHFLYL